MQKLDMEKLSKIIIGIFCVLTTSIATAGGGWTQKKGDIYVKLSQWWLVADQHYTDIGIIAPNATVGVFNTSLYAEYGITNKLTGIVYMPFFSRSLINSQVSKASGITNTPGAAINTFGDSDIAFKYALRSGKKISIAAKLQFGLPIGEPAGGPGKNLQTGDGEFNQLIQFDAGMPIKIDKNGKIAAYTNIYTGFNNRTKGFSDEFRYGAEFGLGFKDKKIWTIAKLNSVVSLKNGDLVGGSTTNGIFANNTEYVSIAFEGAYKLNSTWGISAEYATAVSGSLILARPSYSVGIFYDLKK